MNKLTTGLLTAGIIGAIGVGYMATDRRTKNKLQSDGKKMLDKASDIMDKF